MPATGNHPLTFELNEKVLCFHMDMLYDAKIIDLGPLEGDDSGEIHYKVHYRGWKNTWDDWVPAERIRKMTDENRQLAQSLMNQAKEMQRQAAASAKPSKKPIAPKTAGTAAFGLGDRAVGRYGTPMTAADSTRGSEEERSIGVAAAPLSGRGPRRTREFDLELVSGECRCMLWTIRTI